MMNIMFLRVEFEFYFLLATLGDANLKRRTYFRAVVCRKPA